MQKYLAPSPATSKGHLKKQHANVRTTRPKTKLEDAVPIKDEFEDPSPIIIPNANVIRNSHGASTVFYCATLGDATTGTIYTDTTCAFPVTPLENMQAYFVAYDYKTNTIFAKQCLDFKEVQSSHQSKRYSTN